MLTHMRAHKHTHTHAHTHVGWWSPACQPWMNLPAEHERHCTHEGVPLANCVVPALHTWGQLVPCSPCADGLLWEGRVCGGPHRLSRVAAPGPHRRARKAGCRPRVGRHHPSRREGHPCRDSLQQQPAARCVRACVHVCSGPVLCARA